MNKPILQRFGNYNNSLQARDIRILHLFRVYQDQKDRKGSKGPVEGR